MKFLKLHRKVPAQTKKFNGEKMKDPLRKIPPKVKVMTMYKMTEEVKKECKKLAIHCRFNLKEGNRISSQIRIQLEETKRKVRVCSPAALQFIGPGDQKATLYKKGGICI
jgi:predicted CoA-binding protein